MGQALIEDLLLRQAASRAQIDEALRRHRVRGGSLAALLVEVGCAPEDVLDALSRTTGLPKAPPKVLEREKPPAKLQLSPEVWWRLRVAPVGWYKGVLVVVLSDPDAIRDEKLKSLGRARVYLALEDAVTRALTRMFGPDPAARTLESGPAPAAPGADVAAAASGFEEDAPTIAENLGDRSPPPEDSEHDSTTALSLDEIQRALAEAGALPMPPKAAGSGDGELEAPTVAMPRLRPDGPAPDASEDPFAISTTQIEEEEDKAQSAPKSSLDEKSACTDPVVPERATDEENSALAEATLAEDDDAPSEDNSAFLFEEETLGPLPPVPPAAPSCEPSEEALAEPPPTAEAEGSGPTVQLPRPDVKRERLEELALAPTSPGTLGEGEGRDIGVPGYRVLDVLGEGGMAVVYRARRLATGEVVALKVLSERLGADAGMIERFRREIRSTSALEHPHIVRVLDYGVAESQPYLVSELMDGGSLRDVMADARMVPVALFAKLLEHLLLGLAHAHAHGVVHRDLKPANLLLSRAGALKIADFGIAKRQTDNTITRTGALFGTPAYMSPEQALGQTVDPRSDLFSAGVVAYEMLTGLNPFVAETPSATLFRVARAALPSALELQPGTPPLVLDVLDRLLAKDRDARYGSADDALRDLAPLLDVIDQRYPDLLRRYLEAPMATLEALRRDHGQAELSRARAFLRRSPPEAEGAGLAACAAAAQIPAERKVARLLEELFLAHGIQFQPTRDPRIVSAERELEKSPEAPGLLRHLADLYRAAKNPHRAAAYLVRYLAHRPRDSHARHQLERILGKEPLGAFAPALSASEPEEETSEPPSALDWQCLKRPGEAEPEPPPRDEEPRAPAAEEREPPTPTPKRLPPAPEPVAAVAPSPSPGRGGFQVLSADQSLRPLAPPPRPAHRLGIPLPERNQPLGPARKPRKGLLLAAAALGAVAVLGVGAVIGSLLAPSQGLAEQVAARVDPGPGVPIGERQRVLFERAEQHLRSGDSLLARVMLDRLIALDGSSDLALAARVARARALKELDSLEDARADLEIVLERLPPKNLLHVQARQLLRELDQQEPLSGAPARARGARPRGP